MICIFPSFNDYEGRGLWIQLQRLAMLGSFIVGVMADYLYSYNTDNTLKSKLKQAGLQLCSSMPYVGAAHRSGRVIIKATELLLSLYPQVSTWDWRPFISQLCYLKQDYLKNIKEKKSLPMSCSSHPPSSESMGLFGVFFHISLYTEYALPILSLKNHLSPLFCISARLVFNIMMTESEPKQTYKEQKLLFFPEEPNSPISTYKTAASL